MVTGALLQAEWAQLVRVPMTLNCHASAFLNRYLSYLATKDMRSMGLAWTTFPENEDDV